MVRLVDAAEYLTELPEIHEKEIEGMHKDYEKQIDDLIYEKQDVEYERDSLQEEVRILEEGRNVGAC